MTLDLESRRASGRTQQRWRRARLGIFVLCVGSSLPTTACAPDTHDALPYVATNADVDGGVEGDAFGNAYARAWAFSIPNSDAGAFAGNNGECTFDLIVENRPSYSACDELLEPNAKLISINIMSEDGPCAVGTWPFWTNDQSDAFLQDLGSACTGPFTSGSGTLTITALSSTQVSGSFSLDLPDASTLSGDFDSTVCPLDFNAHLSCNM